MLGVFGTPFVLLFAWSGAVYGLAAPFMSFMGEAVYAGDQAKAVGLYYGPELERAAMLRLRRRVDGAAPRFDDLARE